MLISPICSLVRVRVRKEHTRAGRQQAPQCRGYGHGKPRRTHLSAFSCDAHSTHNGSGVIYKITCSDNRVMLGK